MLHRLSPFAGARRELGGCDRDERCLSACRGLGSVVGPLLVARALPLRCAASTSTGANFYTASYLTKILAVVICGSGSTCVSVLSS
jgi:hypothetical protein